MDRRPIDWRLIVAWTAMLAISWVATAHVTVADEARRGHALSIGRALAIEGTSHLVLGALLPAMYWLHRRWPLGDGLRNVLIHVVGVIPFSLAHTTGMAALRVLWFAGILGEAFRFPLTVDRLLYEFSKDIVTYCMVTGGIMGFRYLFQRIPETVAPVQPAVPASLQPARPERFAVRKRGGSEVVVEVADIDWIEAAGNYAILHVGGEKFEIRSSLTKLEDELDPRRFVRVHKSHLVNIARVAEVTPWVSGDWRIRLQDGAEVNLSRRYRQRFEALAPVRS
jgi:hypothetical protein